MSVLPALRSGLDLMPSPDPEHPGLLIRDPFRYSDRILIVPPALVPLLALFDGARPEAELREALVRLTGELVVTELIRHFVGSLSSGGFLDDEVAAGLREARHRDFAAAPRREPAHAGAAYPDEPQALRAKLGEYMDGPRPPAGAGGGGGGLVGIAAPHVSPDGGWRSYAGAYRALGPELADRTFIVLGTSHYGEPESFGLTAKPFATPLGQTRTAPELLERLAREGGPAVRMEDYCHAVEHSIEFQVLFLQHLYGAGVRVLPVLCGAFARSLREGGRPEDDPGVARFLDVLGGLAVDGAPPPVWVLGVDMAHVGRRYGDGFAARVGTARMAEVAREDHARLERVAAGDAHGFWELVQPEGDSLKWCGSAPLYAFLRAVAPTRGELLDYGQWNIDAASVVSFAGLAFRR